MPHVGVPRGRPEGALLAAAADEDRETLLDRPDEDLRVRQVVVAARLGDALAVDELADDLRGLREARRALAGRAEVEAVRVVLERVPGRADPEDRAPT